MAKDSLFRWKDISQGVSPDQVYAVLSESGITIRGESDAYYYVLCPFHNNKGSSAATVSKDSGFLFCFNPSCNARMKLVDVVEKILDCGEMTAKRFISKFESERKSIQEVIDNIYAEQKDFPEFDSQILARMQSDYAEHAAPRRYIASRGIKESTAKFFGLGFDVQRNMIVTPMFDTNARCIGVIGRTISGEKRFRNSVDLPSRRTLFNINNAKKAGSDSLIIVESNFDALRIHQAGYPNVCATLGGSYSDEHLAQVNRHFNRLIIMTDNDDAGQKFAQRIAKKTRKCGMSVFQARYSQASLFPPGAKDASDCTDEQIKAMIKQAEIMI